MRPALRLVHSNSFEVQGLMDSRDISDAKTGSMSPPADLTTQVLIQIRDNLAAINAKQDRTDGKVDEVNMRVVRLEEREERTRRVEEAVAEMKGKIDMLLRDKDQRDGAAGVFVGVRGWTPVLIAIGAAIASIFSALYLAGRAGGIIAPAPTHVEHPL